LNANNLPEYPHGIECFDKVLNCEIDFQDHEKVLNLEVWQFETQPFVYSNLFSTADDSFSDVFCLVFRLGLKRYLKSMENGF